MANYQDRGPCVSINQFVMDGIVGKFSVGLQSHLFQDMRAMRADCSITERKKIGNLSDCFPRSY